MKNLLMLSLLATAGFCLVAAETAQAQRRYYPRPRYNNGYDYGRYDYGRYDYGRYNYGRSNSMPRSRFSLPNDLLYRQPTGWERYRNSGYSQPAIRRDFRIYPRR